MDDIIIWTLPQNVKLGVLFSIRAIAIYIIPNPELFHSWVKLEISMTPRRQKSMDPIYRVSFKFWKKRFLFAV